MDLLTVTGFNCCRFCKRKCDVYHPHESPLSSLGYVCSTCRIAKDTKRYSFRLTRPPRNTPANPAVFDCEVLDATQLKGRGGDKYWSELPHFMVTFYIYRNLGTNIDLNVLRGGDVVHCVNVSEHGTEIIEQGAHTRWGGEWVITGREPKDMRYYDEEARRIRVAAFPMGSKWVFKNKSQQLASGEVI
jgi:hypothetical protein